jgi:hypothetical protein
MELGSQKSHAAVVTLQHFRDIPEALLAKGKLESAGIPCLLADGNLVRMDWLLSNAIGGIRLQVHQEDLESARGVLEEPIPEEFYEEEVGESFTQPRCPRCYSLDIGFRFSSTRTTGSAIPAARNGWKSSC